MIELSTASVVVICITIVLCVVAPVRYSEKPCKCKKKEL